VKKIEIELTENQEKFLKIFAEKQYSGAKDNVCTCDPIHCVQQKRYHVFDYDSGLGEYLDEEMYEIIFLYDVDDTVEFKTAAKLVEYFYSFEDNEPPSKIVDFDDSGCFDYQDYFEKYKIDDEYYRVLFQVAYWEDTAFFWILDEAKEYLKYQKHNLNEPRTYTKSGGYANHGSYVPFRDLLMKIGVQLNQEGEEE